MKYLITGGAGFIGSHLAEALLKNGHSVIVLDDFSTGARENLMKISHDSRLEMISGSILDRKLVEQCFVGIDGCFHMAAAVGVEKILKDPIGSLKTNIHGSENVLETATSHDVPILLASTSEIYGKNTSESLTEDSDRIIGSPLLSRWTYSEAKALDESFARALYEQRNLKVKIIRYFNTVGPRQSHAYGMVIPKFFYAAMRNLPLIVHGDGNQQRIFCHVEDSIRGTLSVWNLDGVNGEVFNLAGNEEISILELAHRVIEMCGSKSKIEFISYKQMRGSGFEDIKRRRPNIEKIKKLTGWSPELGINEILRDYFIWAAKYNV